jgi:hypothetical protein
MLLLRGVLDYKIRVKMWRRLWERVLSSESRWRFLKVSRRDFRVF